MGTRTRIQSHSFVCELVSIGEDCVVGPRVMFVKRPFRGGPAHAATRANGSQLFWRPVSSGLIDNLADPNL